MQKYDVIFLGSGHASSHGAAKLARSGKKVALIEGDTLMGTCTNYGCNAKMFLDGPADVLHQIHAYQGQGLAGNIQIDWSTLMKNKKEQLDDPQKEGMRQMFAKMGIDIIDGWGKIKDAHHIIVGEDEYETDYIIIGTGLRPAKLAIPGQEYLHDSRDYLRMDEMPKRMVFIGGGIISYEFAALSRAAGSDVTVIHHSDRPLRNYYSRYGKKLTKDLQAAGIKFEFNQNVNAVTKNEQGYQVTTKEGLSIDTDYVLDATGRVANFEKLGLDKLKIPASTHGIKVDSHLRTSIKNIFASGDVIDKSIPKLTPTAMYESNYIAREILNPNNPAIQYPPVAEVVFSLPRLAQVGVNIDAAKASGNYTVKRIPYGSITFETKNEPKAEATIAFDDQGAFAGATVLGNQAGPLINLLTLAIAKHMTPEDVENETIMAFPDESFGLFKLITGIL